eukprot:550976-Karenia_brevis.AAC.1
MAGMPFWPPLPEQFSFKAVLLFSSCLVSMQRQDIILGLAMDAIFCGFLLSSKQMWLRPEQQFWVPT